MLFSLRILGILSVVFGVFIIGCGGGGSSTATGKVLVHISWPGRARYIPPYANSIVCQLTVNKSSTLAVTANRPSDQPLDGTIAFPQSIPTGSYPLTINAYSEANGQGQIVATATISATVQPGKPTQIDVSTDLQTTIDRVVIEGQPLTVPVGERLQLKGHAEDATGFVLLLPAGTLTWSSPAIGDVGSLDAGTGVFVASAAGRATICLTESTANKQAQAELTVTASTSPSAVTVQVNWPGRGRYVPPYANSISCRLKSATYQSETLIVNRTQDDASTASVNFPSTVDAGQYTLTVSAFDQANAAG
jgi:hypothetical protein